MVDWGAFIRHQKGFYQYGRRFSFDDITIVADNAVLMKCLSQIRRRLLGYKTLLYNDQNKGEDMETTNASNQVAKLNIQKNYSLGAIKVF